MSLTKSCEGLRNELSAARSPPSSSTHGKINSVVEFAEMELQAVAGLQGVLQCEHPSLCSSHKLPRISRLVSAPRVSKNFSSNSFVARPIRCSSSGGGGGGEPREVEQKVVLKIGSPVVMTQAPPLLKTAEPMPMMRPNNGLINVGDAGRIMDRRPKDTWAVRFAVGAYLIDRKYFEPLEL